MIRRVARHALAKRAERVCLGPLGRAKATKPCRHRRPASRRLQPRHRAPRATVKRIHVLNSTTHVGMHGHGPLAPPPRPVGADAGGATPPHPSLAARCASCWPAARRKCQPAKPPLRTSQTPCDVGGRARAVLRPRAMRSRRARASIEGVLRALRISAQVEELLGSD